MLHMLIRFWKEDKAQDLVEYSLLLAFIALAAVGVLSNAGKGEKKVWTTINSSIKSAATFAKKAGS